MAATREVSTPLVLQFVSTAFQFTHRLCLEQVHSLSRSQTPELGYVKR